VVTIEQIDRARSGPSLGQECHFGVQGEAVVAVEYFLEHESVFYPDPLKAEPDHTVRLYPEAPGRYALHAGWRTAEGQSGWTRTEFHVAGPEGAAPQQVATGGERLWVPTAWDRRLISTHEKPVFRELQKIIRPRATVYDIGANVGLFSVRFARWIGSEGWLYAIEPNPICVCLLRANFERIRARNLTILPVALSNAPGHCTFTVNYGSSLIGVGTDSTVPDKPGHRIQVETQSLDGLIAKLRLRKPDFIKLDVEGAEAAAVSGMMETLERHRPSLMIELHGRQAAEATLPQLARLRYTYLLCATGAQYASADTLLTSLPDACVQVIGRQT
jgi:FkbM family methyltransferase